MADYIDRDAVISEIERREARMDEHNQLYDDMDWKETDKKKEDAKNEFFKLFSERFYGLWD